MRRILLKAGVLNLLDHGLKILAVFFMTPFILGHLGNEQYGLWAVIYSILSYLEFLDLGASNAGTRFYARESQAETSRRADLLRVIHRFYRGVAAMALLFTIGLLFTIQYLLPAQYATSHGIRGIVVLLGIVITVRFLTRPLLIVLRANLRQDIVAWSEMARLLVQTITTVLLLNQGWGINGLAWSFLLGAGLQQAFILFAGTKLLPKAQVNSENGPVVPMVELITTSLIAFTGLLGNQLRTITNPLILSKMVSLEAVTLYAVGARFIMIFDSIVNSLFGGQLLVAFSRILATNRHADRQFLESTKYSVWFVTFCAGGLALLGPPFIERWLGEGFEVSQSLLLLLLIPASIRLCQYPAGDYLFSMKRYALSYITLALALLNVLACVILSRKIGIMGVIYPTCIEAAIRYGIIVPFLICHNSGISIVSYVWSTVVQNIALASIPFLILAPFIKYSISPSYLIIITWGAGCFIVFTAYASVVLLTSEQRVRVIHSIIKRK
ncbi:MAG: oligosaccharide flippase family protein [Verrucomicrobiales bacterium]|nr:oligosaccharide flippase family protein [Verrucomicrobiales bacterium]